jgi:glycerophosphoryl diester phosphodiesterase
VTRHRVLISAHRGGYAELSTEGAGDRSLENTLEALQHAVDSGADYVEFDVRRCTDGTFVVSHDPEVGPHGQARPIKRMTWPEVQATAEEVLRLSAFVTALAPTGVGAHVDLKFATPRSSRQDGQSWEQDLLELLVASLDPGRIIVTTGNLDASVAMRDWIQARDLPIMVGLAVGASLKGLPWRQAAASLWGQLFPRHRFEASRADAVAAHYALAMVRLSRWTRRIGVPLLVWTVDSPRLQRRLLHDPRIWMITTNRPAQAFEIREGRPR